MKRYLNAQKGEAEDRSAARATASLLCFGQSSYFLSAGEEPVHRQPDRLARVKEPSYFGIDAELAKDFVAIVFVPNFGNLAVDHSKLAAAANEDALSGRLHQPVAASGVCSLRRPLYRYDVALHGHLVGGHAQVGSGGAPAFSFSDGLIQSKKLAAVVNAAIVSVDLVDGLVAPPGKKVVKHAAHHSFVLLGLCLRVGRLLAGSGLARGRSRRLRLNLRRRRALPGRRR